MGCQQSLDAADDEQALIKSTGLKNEWIIDICTHEVINGLVRLKLDNWNYFVRYAHRLDNNVIFKLYYRTCSNKHIINESTKWETIQFNHTHVQPAPTPHVNIRVDVNLLDYNMQFKISTLLNDDFIQISHMQEFIRPNIWLPTSNHVTVKIPSSMKSMSSFDFGQWVRFKTSSSSTRFTYGTIKDKILDPNTDECVYHISHYRKDKIYKVRCKKSAKNANIKHLCAHSYVDLTSLQKMENTLLIGDRRDVENEYVNDLYLCLNDLFYNEYVEKYVHFFDNDVHKRSAAKCVAVNVINCLFEKEGGYKMNCLSHQCENRLRLYGQREYAINRALCLKESSYYFEYYCDQCLCVQGDYHWMYRCQLNKECKYNGHDICLNCAYDVIKKCKQLKDLLDEMLANELTDDCIHSIVVHTAGNVVKL